MILGDIKNIDLSVSSFRRMIEENTLYVDKTRMIENFLNTRSQVQLIARQRRLGKSLNMDMLMCFLTDKEDLRHLFKGLYIESSPVWDKANSTPVFYFDFKRMLASNFRQIIHGTICDYIDDYSDGIKLSRLVTAYLNNNEFNNPNGLLYLTEAVYKATGKRPYILIDEYDKLLMDNYDTDMYEELREFVAVFLSAGLKGNQYLEKALLTGVMRISHESILSGLNNIVTFDVFNDKVYTNDYGFTEGEIKCLSSLSSFDIDKMRTWYNGIRIGSHAIYNTYSVASYLFHREYACFWGKSGTMHLIANLLNDRRRATLAKLLNGEQVEVPIANRISLRGLSNKSSDQAFYSLLVQAGYLALHGTIGDESSVASVSIPNKELRLVWRDFILVELYPDMPHIRTLFHNWDSLDLFTKDLEYFLSDRLSYHDLAVYGDEGSGRIGERLYHIFLLGILSAYDDVKCRYPLSNRESGDGRYDILVERPSANFIFEFKTSDSVDNLEKYAQEALTQIETKRYGTDLDSEKKLVRVGIAFHGKRCKVKCS